MQFTAVLMPAEEGGFVALNPETGTSSQGESIEEERANLQEATQLYLEEFQELVDQALAGSRAASNAALAG